MGARPIIQTVNGHELGDVVSALQKSIRRGLTDDALYYATDMDLSGYGNYCWSRLLVMTSEDVGPADTHMPATIRALYQTWLDTKKKKNDHGPERLMLVHAVILLAGSSKSRIVDHALITHYGMHDELRREIPDYVYDGHTRKGRMMKRGEEFFIQTSEQLHNESTLEDPYVESARRVLRSGRKVLKAGEDR